MTESQPIGVIFGIHGSLLNTGHINRRAFDEAFRAFGYPGTPQLDQPVRGMPLRDQLVKWNEALGATLAYDEFVAKVDEIKPALYQKLTIDPALLRFLEELRVAGVKIGIATSTTQIDAERLLGQFDLLRFVDALVTVDETGAGKPRGEVFQTVADRLGVLVHRCVVIEDAASGVAAAHEAGMKAVGFTGYLSGSQPQDLAAADYLADSYDELSPERIQDLVR